MAAGARQACAGAACAMHSAPQSHTAALFQLTNDRRAHCLVVQHCTPAPACVCGCGCELTRTARRPCAAANVQHCCLGCGGRLAPALQFSGCDWRTDLPALLATQPFCVSTFAAPPGPSLAFPPVPGASHGCSWLFTVVARKTRPAGALALGTKQNMASQQSRTGSGSCSGCHAACVVLP